MRACQSGSVSITRMGGGASAVQWRDVPFNVVQESSEAVAVAALAKRAQRRALNAGHLPIRITASERGKNPLRISQVIDARKTV